MAKKEKPIIEVLAAISGLDDKIAKNFEAVFNEIAIKNNANFVLLNKIMERLDEMDKGLRNNMEGHFESARKMKDDRFERIQALMEGKGGFVEAKKPAKQTARKKAKKSTKKKS